MNSLSVRSRSNWNLEVLVFVERGKQEQPEKNLSEQGIEPTTNSTHIWLQHQDLNWQATLVGGKCSHHCNTLSPLVLLAYCKWTKIGVTFLFSLMGFTVQCT